MCRAVSISHLNIPNASYYEVGLALVPPLLYIALSGVINFHYLHPLPEKKQQLWFSVLLIYVMIFRFVFIIKGLKDVKGCPYSFSGIQNYMRNSAALFGLM